MTVAPLIAMKSTKCESLEAVGKELDRRAHTYANDVDQSGSTTRDALRSAECSMKSLLDAMDSADESVSSWKRSEERLDGLGWQLRTSPEGSGREVRG